MPSATGVPPTLAPAPPAPTPLLWQASTQEAEQRLDRYRNNLAGTISERIFYSPALGRSMPYDIYLPPGYDTSGRRYAVLYMLHGGGGHRDEWLGYAIGDVADAEFRSGRLQPLIIVMLQGDTGYWTDNANGGPLWGQYVWRDLVAHLDVAYRTLLSPASRAIGGLSMGGWGALSLTFQHPDVFGVAGVHSASLRADDG